MDNQYVTMAGVVTAVKTKITKKNTTMAYVTLEDRTGSLELLAFNSAIDQGGSYLAEDTAIIVYGRISSREDEEPKLIVSDIYPLTVDYVEQYAAIRNKGRARSRFNDRQRDAVPPLQEIYGAPPAEDIYTSVPAQTPVEGTLYLRLDSEMEEYWDQLKCILRNYPGSFNIKVHFSARKQTMVANGLMVRQETDLDEQLCNLLGQENVVWKRKD